MIAIQIWEFENAPDDFKKLSPHGGDEDWLAFIPDCWKGYWPGWMGTGTDFGISEVTEHIVPYGRVYIGAHA